MSYFETRLAADLVDDGDDLWALSQPLVFVSDDHGKIIVPTGFETNFASVPRLPFAYWLFGGAAKTAATLHDYLYTTGQFPRLIADAVFLDAMRVTGVPGWRALSMHRAVRWFGWSSYRPSR
jgi:hypothetical protein